MQDPNPVPVQVNLDHEIYLWVQWQAARNKLHVDAFISHLVALYYAKETAPAE